MMDHDVFERPPRKNKTSPHAYLVTSLAILIPAVGKMVGQRNVVAVGRISRDNLTPMHFIYLVKAAYLTPQNSTNVGVKPTRIKLVAEQTRALRQQNGFTIVKWNAKKLKTQRGAVSNDHGFSLHCGGDQMWDEAQMSFRWNVKQDLRTRKKGTLIQVLCQNMYITFNIIDHEKNHRFDTTRRVDNTTARG